MKHDLVSHVAGSFDFTKQHTPFYWFVCVEPLMITEEYRKRLLLLRSSDPVIAQPFQRDEAMSPDGTDINWPAAAAAGLRRSVLAADLQVDGDVRSRGAIDVYGAISGSVTAPEVVVAASGDIDGQVLARDLTVWGQIYGVVKAKSVTLASTAVVEADVFHERIAIEADAQFEGRLVRQS